MATRTNPLVSAAVLASTAAIAVATPAIMPSVQIPSPNALAAAKVQLTTFADLLSITPNDWSNVVFGGYGEAISPNQDPDFDWAAAYVSPFTNCNFNCTVNGISGVAYLALDALLNGNGTGYAPVYDSNDDPIAGYPTWNISAVNYFFEGGPGPGTAYLVAQPFGDPKSPLYNPAVASIITQAFNGLANVTNFYVAGLNTLAKLAQQIPAVGPYIYGAINAYLGPNTADEIWGDWGYFAGLSGILRYITDVITTGGNPYPPYGPTPAPLAAVPAPAAAATLVEAPKVEAAPEAAPTDSAPAVSAPAVSAPAVSAPADSAPAAEVEVNAPTENKAENAPAVAEVEVSAPVDSIPEVKDSTSAAVEIPASTPAVEVEAPELPAVDDVAPSAPEVPVVSSKELKDFEKELKAESSAASSSSSAASENKSGGSQSSAGGSAVTSDAPEATSGSSAAGPDASDAKSGGASASGSSDAGSAKDAGDSSE